MVHALPLQETGAILPAYANSSAFFCLSSPPNLILLALDISLGLPFPFKPLPKGSSAHTYTCPLLSILPYLKPHPTLMTDSLTCNCGGEGKS